MTLVELREGWIRRRSILVECGDERFVKVIDLFLTDLDSLAESEDGLLLTLKQAARRSGYSEEHLGRLLRHGQIANAGRKGAPRIRLKDLPLRPAKSVAETERKLYDVSADARSILSRLGER